MPNISKTELLKMQMRTDQEWEVAKKTFKEMPYGELMDLIDRMNKMTHDDGYHTQLIGALASNMVMKVLQEISKKENLE